MAVLVKAFGDKPWKDDEPLECVMVVPETSDTATFTFRAPSGAWFDYQPGQFVTLDLPVPGGNVQRTYTISSSPSRPLSISVTVKAQPGSVGGRWMIDHLRPGMRLKAFGPAGIFSFVRHEAPKYLFISAGSGITPVMSMTTWAWDSGEMPDIVFVHAARSPSEIIFRQRLEGMADRVPGLQLRFTVEDSDPFRTWHGYRGRLNQIMLGLMAPDYLEREVFCCGPEPFMQAVRDMLIALGFDMDHYHQESFGAPIRTEAEAPVLDDVVPDEDSAAQITFESSGVVAKCNETDTVLAVAKANGLNIPSGCTFGLCGTCKIRKTAGEVHMVHNGGITDEDIEEGYILACCSHPIGAVSVEV
ncbi:2Fe-2S iron-sulfur cluster-binding protein [Paracoccus sp. P2]|uniref:Hybrid-cluster NAD(P)-dependent oxidoreductase n=1 Tax=Paracoccus pantotrophus TaxID=82367 RepID=A0A7H9BZH4_PARPN|nr:hybrid-cluster NAD(P)-dependent oxidoreductase [Paracoccus pantotrophus]MDF3854426.1 hybrid-cluster NAD(P)-dependent oxidoreductase [Paracoccus pantotrophus]QLH16228.1 hybrid-cluster NAD(P)-dependent oxidoreductase [Paracoccus pantotrophus]RDE02014.1 hybrid-cluster NAD(P)-dependent oxidoreductase [Paracoccus pantotrophus]RNI19309.1 hybrid-cluster NAD(P)-dependent oxidoreductase [Paracoccus pantotrophus]WGR64254.1 hybrid-cluster NAD(P)-dependent oxidoreductase [Paracoccus pantotrophus]